MEFSISSPLWVLLFILTVSIKSISARYGCQSKLEPKKSIYYSPEGKTFFTKNSDHELPANVCFYAFSVKRKENDLDRKHRLLGGPAENASSPTISQIEQNLFYFIYKHLEQGVTFQFFLNFGKYFLKNN